MTLAAALSVLHRAGRIRSPWLPGMARRIESTVQRRGELLEQWPADPSRHGGWRYVLLLAKALMTAGLASRVVRLARVDGRLVEVP